MFYLFPDVNNECSIHFQPELLTPEEKARGIAVESLPVLETKPGKYAVLKANKATGNVWYDYLDNPEVVTLQGLLNDALALLKESGVL